MSNAIRPALSRAAAMLVATSINAALASATDVGIGTPGSVATDARGNVYFSSPNLVLKLDTAGRLTRLAGTGMAGSSGDGGPATNALLDNMPFDSYPEKSADWIDYAALVGGIATDATGNVYIADAYNSRIRRVAPNGTITTVLGYDQALWPQGVAVDNTGTLYVANSWGTVKSKALSGAITTLASFNCGPSYLEAGVCVPEGLALAPDGALYVADGYCRVRKISRDGSIITVAGDDSTPDGHGSASTCGHTSDTGPATKAALAWPYGVAVDRSGNLVIADTSNHCIRRVDAAGDIATVAGACGVAGFRGDGDLATHALLDMPYGVAADAAGNLFIADTFNERIRRVSADGLITTVAGNGGAIPSDLPVESTVIGPGFTGAWYDPNQSGHGLFIEVLPENRFYVAWFAFNPAGTEQAWFTGVGTYSGNSATITQVEQPTGGRWIPNFDPTQIARNRWGTLTFTFIDCNHGTVEFNSMGDFGTGSMNLTRLTQPGGLTCP